LLLLLFSAPAVVAQESAAEDPITATEDQAQVVVDTLEKLHEVRLTLGNEIKRQQNALKKAASDTEKQEIQKTLAGLQQELQANNERFDRVALGIDSAIGVNPEKHKFELQKELQLIFEPLFTELKQSTKELRKKSTLKENITSYQELLGQINQALHNIDQLLTLKQSKAVKKQLKQLRQHWIRQRDKTQSSLEAAKLELDIIERNSVSFSQASQKFFKEFFKKRGLYLGEAIGAVLLLFLLFRLIHRAMVKYIPGFQKPHRSLSIRLTDLIYRVFTVLILFFTPLVVFYLREDWVLFSIVLLVLIGAAWGIRKVAPFYWKQAILMLNIGSVREGERLHYEGLPWKVERINFYTDLVNPSANLHHRIPLEKMVGMISRPVRKSTEQWFPCQQGDWVVLDDGTRGEVISITHEYVELQKRGGATKTYLIQDFLAQAPLNLSDTFRIKEVFGISYNHQQQSTNVIIGKLKGYISEQLEKEGHAPFLIEMKVEFNEAADSSLNLVVIADFKGEMAPLLNRLRRAIQRWCVDAATANEWEIPFPQLTLHRAED
jgi:hypothetical protein